MTLFSSTQPSLRARILPRFPAQVLAGSGMTITKTGGVYTFAANFDNIPLSGLVDISSDTLLGRDTAGSGAPEEITVGDGIGFDGAGSLQLTANQRIRYISIPISGSPISTGIKADFFVPFACTITKATLLADQVGDIVVDIWKAIYNNFPPTVTGTITALAKPTISAATKSQDTTLVGWTTSVAAGDILRFNVDSVATLTRVVLALDVTVI